LSPRWQAQRRADVVDEADRLGGVFRVRVRVRRALHRLGGLSQGHLFPALDGHEFVEERARLVRGVGELLRRAPSLAGALLEQADRVVRAAGQVA
jgi:hypothetical protein